MAAERAMMIARRDLHRAGGRCVKAELIDVTLMRLDVGCYSQCYTCICP